jgi:hypothetical protein
VPAKRRRFASLTRTHRTQEQRYLQKTAALGMQAFNVPPATSKPPFAKVSLLITAKSIPKDCSLSVAARHIILFFLR